MFEIILLVIGLYALLLKKEEWTITIMVFLAFRLVGLGDGMLVEGTLARLNAALILMFALWIYCKQNYRIQNVLTPELQSVFSFQKYLFIYVVINVVIDFIINGIDLWSVLRTSRHWVFLLTFVPISMLPAKVLKQSVYNLFIISMLVTVVIVIEQYTGFHYFTRNHSISGMGSDGFRGAIPTTFAVLFIFMLYNGYKSFDFKKKFGYLGIIMLTVLRSAIRSQFIGIAAGVVISAYYTSRNKIFSIVKVATLGVVLLGTLYATPVLRNRFLEADEVKYGINEDSEGTFAFRINLITERFEYLCGDPIKLMFGVGSVANEDFTGHRFNLNTLAPFDSGDTCWVAILCRLGLIGTILLVILLVKYINFFSRHKLNNLFAMSMMCYLIIWLFPISFASYEMQCGYFWILPAIFAKLVSDENQKI